MEVVSRNDVEKSVKEGILHTLEVLDRPDERKSRKETQIVVVTSWVQKWNRVLDKRWERLVSKGVFKSN